MVSKRSPAASSAARIAAGACAVSAPVPISSTSIPAACAAKGADVRRPGPVRRSVGQQRQRPRPQRAADPEETRPVTLHRNPSVEGNLDDAHARSPHQTGRQEIAAAASTA